MMKRTEKGTKKKKAICSKRVLSTLLLPAVLLLSLVLFPQINPVPVQASYEDGHFTGIDVSSHNGTMNWKRAVQCGVEFAIIRIGWGDDYKNQDDSQAIRNMQECERLGIPYGVYIYSYALTSAQVDSEIKHTLRMIKGFDPPLGVWFDMEDADYYKYRYGMNPYTHGAELTQFCLQFMRGIKKAGYPLVGTYANTDYFNNVLDYNSIKKEGFIWLAHWGPKAGWPYDMWQYTEQGMKEINGKNFDTNRIEVGSTLSKLIFEIPFKVETYIRNPKTEYILGDITGDRKITLADLAKLKDHIMGRVILGKDAANCADVNLDGTISLKDLTILKKHILGVENAGED
ncbi:MAG: hypothetical protein IKF90_18140, partial [Parasporobacterium sp.]|nr:hypothetical protein [Parasporobacterium sp.]